MHVYAGAEPLEPNEAHAIASAQLFAEFVTRNTLFAYRVAYARLRNSSDAEDAVQESFLKLYRSGRWQMAENERAFLARTVWRMADTLRKRNPPTRPDEPDTRPSAAHDPEQQLMQSSAEAAVHRLIDALPEKLRQPLVLSSLGEMRSAEVAAILNVPEGTVRRRVMEARTLLRTKLNALNTSLEVNRG